MRKEMPTLKRILSISVLQNMSAVRNAEENLDDSRDCGKLAKEREWL